MTQIPTFEESVLQSLCDILADTNEGLTGSEIGHALAECGIDDPLPGQTKRHRLFHALQQRQVKDRCGNAVVAVLYYALHPVRYTKEPQLFDIRRGRLNEVLAFAGLELGQDGKLRERAKTDTLAEARDRAGKLYRGLVARGTHPDVLRFCRAELLQDNYFHAVFEACKSIADKIRDKSGLSGDGSRLVEEAFGGASPILAVNSLRTEPERSEQAGLLNLLKGLFGTFRNTTAHAPKISWPISEQDALDLLSLVSLLHRRLDACVQTHRPS